MNSKERGELNAFLNESDVQRSRRRKTHHLEADQYSVVGGVYAVTLCARHHIDPFLNDKLSECVIGALRFYRDRGDWGLLAFCLMPDHLHVVVELRRVAAAPNAVGAVGALVTRFKRYTTHEAWGSGLHGPLWQRGLYDHVPREPESIERQCRYVLENPVRKGLVADWREYRWSGGEMYDLWLAGLG